MKEKLNKSELDLLRGECDKYKKALQDIWEEMPANPKLAITGRIKDIVYEALLIKP